MSYCGSAGHSFAVRGIYDQLPEGQAIWPATFAIYLDDDGQRRKLYWPQTAAAITQLPSTKTWRGHINYIDGPIGATLEFAVLVVGTNGQALFAHYDHVGHEHDVWPPVKRLTDDVVEAAIGKVRMCEATTQIADA
jgi:hypothetical protein